MKKIEQLNKSLKDERTWKDEKTEEIRELKGKIKEKDEEIESLRSIYEEYELMKNTLEDLSSSIIETEK